MRRATKCFDVRGKGLCHGSKVGMWVSILDKAGLVTKQPICTKVNLITESETRTEDVLGGHDAQDLCHLVSRSTIVSKPCLVNKSLSHVFFVT